MKTTLHSIGAPAVSPGQASDIKPRFGWRRLEPYAGHKGAEQAVARFLISNFGVFVTHAGDRNQSHDIEVADIAFRRPDYDEPLSPGLYEVKSLWRRDGSSVFDRRFKAGTRGERIYGRRDSEIKAFALTLESLTESIIADKVASGLLGHRSENMDLVEEIHAFVDDAISRRHSKKFEMRLMRLAQRAFNMANLSSQAQSVIDNPVQAHDIVRGFDDIQGIFIVAGPLFTLVTKAEMRDFLAFDSASSEGPKIRLRCVVPCETPTKTRKDKTQRKGKKK